jgi:hypothetical protein
MKKNSNLAKVLIIIISGFQVRVKEKIRISRHEASQNV